MEEQSFAQDYAEIMQEQRARGMSRRAILRSALALGVAPLALGVRGAFAQGRPEVVLVNWGGLAVEVFQKAFADPFNAKGGNLVIDGSGPVNGKILTMVQSNSVTWDICDAGVTTIAGAVPLILASGAGAETRSVIGIVVVWGVAVSMFVTLILIPVLYSLLARRTGSPQAVRRQLEQESQSGLGG